ncbi:hypothetical protein UMM65_02925 [Aureibaculum sp. 2210JD6-5]|uniref:hypothetical protein n=1 Tax=Aureibaculum sp. 2210JD6-5 TaxID=3103957 RepID=UPI002AADB8D2|nr:hypothetical protein [Aureibaculum sp. 2210JD6-5]MDY7394180.1 hypothetical protein [Aureibaculum sp. 2210JD6-5]
MDIKRRFVFFGFGFSLGIILLLFFLNGKEASCNYFPNARMLEILRSKHRVFDAEVYQIMNNKNIDSTEVAEMLLNGDIDFSKSKVRQEPCRYYWIDGYIKAKEASIYVENCDTIVTVQKLLFSE